MKAGERTMKFVTLIWTWLLVLPLRNELAQRLYALL